jgi:hypothetical protein
MNYEKTSDGIVINNNDQEYARYKQARERAQAQKQLEQKVHNLEKDMSDIKNLLVSISNRIV